MLLSMEIQKDVTEVAGRLPSLGAGHRWSGGGAAQAVALLGFFMVTLDALVVSVALPAIKHDLGGGMTGLQWVVDGYTLAFAALLLSAGALSDRMGARWAFVTGLTLFIVASAACGLASSLNVLVAARLVQGAGAALTMPASLTLIREAFPDAVQRARAIAVWAIGGAVASAAGPLVGGGVTLLSWRGIFFINLPVGIVALSVLSHVPRSPRRPAPIDWAGQFAVIVGMGALTYGAIEAGAVGLAAPRVLAVLAAALGARLMFLAIEAHVAHPMMPLALVRSRPVAISASIGFTFTVGFYGLVFLFSLYFQQLRDLSPPVTGLAFMPMTALSIVLNPVAARLVERYGPRLPIATGQVLMAVGLLSLGVAAAGAPIPLLSLLMIPVGCGAALAIPTTTALLINSVPADRAGTASGVLNTCRQTGGVLSVAVFGALVAHHATFLTGLRISLVIAALLLLATALASLLLQPTSTASAAKATSVAEPRELPAVIEAWTAASSGEPRPVSTA